MSEKIATVALRVLVCGGMSQGQSTLVGRLLQQAQSGAGNAAVAGYAEFQCCGVQGAGMDFAQLFQGVQATAPDNTLPVTYHILTTPQRRFALAQAPIAELYTRTVVAGAAGAQLAVIVVDARNGIQASIRRLLRIVAMMDIQHVLLAVNMMDLVGFDAAVFGRLDAELRAYVAGFDFVSVQAIPLSALHGDNVAAPSTQMPWHTGPSVIDYLHALDVSTLTRLQATTATTAAADQFEARLLWMGEQALMPGRSYVFKLQNREVRATVTEIKFREALDTGERLAAKTVGVNGIALVNVSLADAVVFAPYAEDRRLGGFILVDPVSHELVGVGMLVFALWRAANIHWQALVIDKAARASLKHQAPRCLWFTGLSGSGKSTVANLLEQRLFAAGVHTYILDGDNVRHGLNRDLGFTEADRIENIRRVGEVAKLMLDAGLVVLVSFISPFRADRDMARSLFSQGEFLEIFVDAPLVECEQRDPKGLYAKARRGELKNFTGIDSPYEAPLAPDIHLQTAEVDVEKLVDQIAVFLQHPMRNNRE